MLTKEGPCTRKGTGAVFGVRMIRKGQRKFACRLGGALADVPLAAPGGSQCTAIRRIGGGLPGPPGRFGAPGPTTDAEAAPARGHLPPAAARGTAAASRWDIEVRLGLCASSGGRGTRPPCSACLQCTTIRVGGGLGAPRRRESRARTGAFAAGNSARDPGPPRPGARIPLVSASGSGPRGHKALSCLSAPAAPSPRSRHATAGKGPFVPLWIMIPVGAERLSERVAP